MPFKPTQYQQAVFDWIQHGSGNLIIQAVAGSGKTTTIMQGLEKIPRNHSVLMLAFNKSIAEELKERIAVMKRRKGSNMANVIASTQNGAGFSILRDWAKSQQLTEIKNLTSEKYNELIKKDELKKVFGIYDGKDRVDIESSISNAFQTVYADSKVNENSIKYKKTNITLYDTSTIEKEIARYEDNKNYYLHYFLTFFNCFIIGRMFKTLNDFSKDTDTFLKYLDKINKGNSNKVYQKILTTDQISRAKEGSKAIKSEQDSTKKSKLIQQLINDLSVEESSLYADTQSKVKYSSSVFVLDDNDHLVPRKLNDLNLALGLSLFESLESYKQAKKNNEEYEATKYQFALGERALKSTFERSLIKCVDLAKSNGFSVTQILSDNDLKTDTYWLRMIYYYQIVRFQESTDILLTLKSSKFIDVLKDVFYKSIKNRNIITFSDQLFQCAKYQNDLKFTKFDWVIIDECQDTNLVTQILLENLLKPKTGRLIAIGDVSQAIYGFRGASATAMQSLKSRFNCTELPLSECFRCAKQIIRLAQMHMPSIEARPEAPQGLVENVGYIEREAKKRDFPLMYFSSQNITSAIISRSNYPLIEIAKLLAEAKIPFYFMGKDVSSYFINELKRRYNDYLHSTNQNRMKHTSTQWQKVKIDNIEPIVDEMPDSQIGDKEDIDLNAELEDINPKSLFKSFIDKAKNEDEIKILDKDDNVIESGHYFVQLENVIKDSFSSEPIPNAIGLTTVHKSKGREFFRVFLLDYGRTFYQQEDKIREWQKEQEKNMAYVAITRAEKELLFINMESRIGIKYERNRAIPYMMPFDASIFRMYKPSASDPFIIDDISQLQEDEARLFGVFTQDKETGK